MTIYNNASLDDTGEMVLQAKKDLINNLSLFDFIAVRGMSGVVVGSPLALEINKPLVIVRKPNEGSHDGCRLVNHYRAQGRFIFFDDFISTGETRRIVIQTLTKTRDAPYCKYVGTYTYEHGGQMLWGPWTE